MDESDIQKYVLSQAAIEVEHNRSWPTKVMAFYIAINFGLATALIALKDEFCSGVLLYIAKIVITSAFLILALWVLRILRRNHKKYLTYRNVQIVNQIKFLKKKKGKFGIPDEWFDTLEVRASNRFCGWGFYAYIVALTTFLVLVGMWLII